MIFQVEKRRSRQNGKLVLTRCYYLRYRVGDMPVDRWKSLGVTDFQVANKKAQQFIQEQEREASGIIEPKLARDAAQRPLLQHLNDYEADLQTRGRAGPRLLGQVPSAEFGNIVDEPHFEAIEKPYWAMALRR